jgi:hypothetical protein
MDKTLQTNGTPASKVPGNDEVVVEMDPTSRQSVNGRIADNMERCRRALNVEYTCGNIRDAENQGGCLTTTLEEN